MKTRLCMLVAAVALLASCSKGTDPDTITQQAITGCYTYYYNPATGESKAGAPTGYTIELNYTKATCSIAITGLTLPNGTAYPAVTLPDMPLSIGAGDVLSLNANSVQSSISGFSTSPLFTSVKCRLIHRIINDSYAPAFVISYTVGGYDVTSSIPEAYLFGSTVSTGPDGIPFSTEETQYTIKVASTLDKATISMSGAHFIQQMPALDIDLPDVPMTFDGMTYHLQAAAITPQIKGVPNEGFPITNFEATINIAGESNLNFSCDPRTIDGVFRVAASLSPEK